MRILQILTYYTPYISGISVYAQRLATAFTSIGCNVTTLTSKHFHELPSAETAHGHTIIRVPVFAFISKGVLMPAMIFQSAALIRKCDGAIIHLPQTDAFYLALWCWLFKKPFVVTFHCQLTLARTLSNRMIQFFMNKSHNVALFFASHIVVTTHDYIDAVPVLRKYIGKVTMIPPPICLPQSSPTIFSTLINRNHHAPLVGVVSRLSSEKGVHTLLEALPIITETYPNIKVLFAGPHEGIPGESNYRNRIETMSKPYVTAGQWEDIGLLNDVELASFYSGIDLLVMPSTNSTESFGMVQIEAYQSGTCVVAPNLPGVRIPVQMTGFGALFEPGNPESLASAIISTLKNNLKCGTHPWLQQFEPVDVARQYIALFDKTLNPMPPQRRRKDG